MDISLMATAFVTMFVIIDPIGLAPLFVALTAGRSVAERRKIAIHATMIGAIILALFGFFGKIVLNRIGIGMPAFQISGGLLLFLIAVEMLFEKRAQRRGQSADSDVGPDPSVFPLATPLIAGPGAMTTMILLTGQHSGDLTSQLEIQLVMLAVVALVFLFFLAGSFMEKLLGHTGITVISRILGVLLAAMSVQFVLNGLGALNLVPGLTTAV